jgi:putative DNA primase/helicase
MGGKVDSHKSTEVRSQLGPLKDIAERLDIAISAITHPPKSSGQRAIDHFIGSQAFIAAARIGHVCIAEVEEDEDGTKIPTGRILFTNAKNNAGVAMPTLAYRIVQAMVGQDSDHNMIVAPHIVWDGVVNVTSDQAVGAATSIGKKPKGNQHAVQKFLSEMLSSGLPVPQPSIQAEATKRGFSYDQLRTASQKLGVVKVKAPGKDGGWTWRDPDQNPEKELPI